MSQSTPSPSDSPAPRCRPWVRVVLFLSLALNLIVVGIVGGAVLNGSRGDERPDRIVRELGLGPYLTAMDEDGRADLKSEALKRKSDLRKDRKAWRTAISETLDVLRTDPFDEARFLGLIESQAENADRQRQVGQVLLADQLARMTPEQRADFAKALERSFRFGGGDRQPDKRGDGKGHPQGTPKRPQ